MKENKVVEAIGKVDDKYINEAINYKPKKKYLYTGFMSVAALAACLLLIFGINAFRNGNKVTPDAVDSVVSIDINPSIELKINKNNKVLEAIALNDDATVVLGDMDFKNADLDLALNAIMGSLLKNGYLDQVYNAINVCVESEDEERANQVGESVSGEISSIFNENDLIGGVNTQTCVIDEEVKKAAESYGISVGKYCLAKKVSDNLGISLDVLVEYTISELWDLTEAEGVEFITKEEALAVALLDAQVEESEIVLESNVIQGSEGTYTYVIKFNVGDCEMYKYKINAVDGTVLERDYKYVLVEENPDEEGSVDEENGDTSEDATEDSTEDATEGESDSTADTEEETTAPAKPEKHLTKIEALNIAYVDAGVDEKNAKLEELKHKPKEQEYHIEFSVGLTDYVYIISAVDGNIINKEVNDGSSMDDSTESITPETVITVEEALSIALEKAGVEQSDLSSCDIKYTNKIKNAEYKIHFHVGKDHYEYTVNAFTGEIVDKTPAAPDKVEKPTPPTPVGPAQKPEAPTPVEPLKPHEKAEAAKPAGPADTKVTITFEKEI